MPPSQAAILPVSPYPRFDTPLRITGDAVVIGDLHAPYHNAQFTNKVLDLAAAWGISNLALNGDATDFHALSKWGAEYRQVAAANGYENLIDVLTQEHVSKGQKAKFLNIIEKAGLRPAEDATGEIGYVREVLRKFSGQFDKVFYVMGNHEDRPIRRMEGIFSGQDLLNLVMGGLPANWFVDAYYFAEVFSGGEKYLLEHQIGASQAEAESLAAKYQCHVICGHAHCWKISHDISGRYWAIMSGHCADELRMSYASARHSKKYAHVPGAVIIRDGYPWVLSERSPFAMLKRM